MASATTLRTRRIKQAVLTSFGSKAATLLVQLIAMPLAIRSLGQTSFALYSMLAAAIGWVGIANVGIGPGLVVSVSTAAAENDRARQKQLFSSALIPVVTLALLIGAVSLLLLNTVPLTKFFGEEYTDSLPTIQSGLTVLLVLALLRTIFSVGEAGQAGFQENHHLNVRSMVASLLSLVTMIGVSQYSPSIVGMILSVNIPFVLAQIANLVWFFSKRPHLIPNLSMFQWHDCKFLLGTGAAYTLASTAGNYLNHQLPTIVVGRTLDAQSTASYAAVMNAFVIAMGVVNMFALPLWPAIADSLTRGESGWAKAAYRRLLLYAMAYAAVIGLALAGAGKMIMRLWFGESIVPDAALLAVFGVYFVLDTWEYVHYTILVGLKQIKIPSLLYAARSLAVAIFTPVSIQMWGEAGVVTVLCASVVLFTAWTYPRLIHVTFQRAREEEVRLMERDEERLSAYVGPDPQIG